MLNLMHHYVIDDKTLLRYFLIEVKKVIMAPRYNKTCFRTPDVEISLNDQS